MLSSLYFPSFLLTLLNIAMILKLLVVFLLLKFFLDLTVTFKKHYVQSDIQRGVSQALWKIFQLFLIEHTQKFSTILQNTLTFNPADSSIYVPNIF